ncbi:type II toxin-antitoxin system HipA family toxin YjjJ [Deefgea salmonis]|uniref:Type II toxin-antitoxin system HipA family toxin YjjJ n=1 Tax=Deefgea salmonis TaxID=2875502 RepID=A0ABS8BPB8_9NEIS|nr:type II toxin-antitoxin system HipA family toxin YjjJ [Deefgea salmonis]MCB5197578.1 type II toxin-antitoxin system HipA family toxin YjjJ [Deefgea salmonis]
MSPRAESIKSKLEKGPLSAKQLVDMIGVSQPTISRAIAELEHKVVSISEKKSIQYALRDTSRKLTDMPIFRIDADGLIRQLGTLIPVRPEGFVMQEVKGSSLHSDGLPWWLFDMRPQGYLGRAYAAQYGNRLQLPERLSDWTDTHALQALLAYGHDTAGNLLIGETARHHCLNSPIPQPIAIEKKGEEYARLAVAVLEGGGAGSSAGGEQPKFTTYAMTPTGTHHAIIKFSEREVGPVSERWRDLLLAEHVALETLREAGIAAAQTDIIDHEGQRFLEVIRFDRIGPLGRCALFSLAALDAEFVGSGKGGWPIIAEQLAANKIIKKPAVSAAQLLWAFGTLIGNSDMHNGNLSFISADGRPYDISPAYDMVPMAFAPRTGGGLPNVIAEAQIYTYIPNETWHLAASLAWTFLNQLKKTSALSERFTPCLMALEQHIHIASAKIARLG